MKYDIREFNSWLKENSNNNLNWGIEDSIQSGKFKTYFFENLEDAKSIDSSLSWNNNHISILKEWIELKDKENEARKIELKKLISKTVHEINNLKLKNNELINWKLQVEEEKLRNKSDDFRGIINSDITNSNTIWSYKRGYYIILLDCYDRLLENQEDKTAREIFDKYKDLMINYKNDNKQTAEKVKQHELLFNEILEVKKTIFELKRELEINEDNNLIESLEKVKIDQSIISLVIENAEKDEENSKLNKKIKLLEEKLKALEANQAIETSSTESIETIADQQYSLGWKAIDSKDK